MFVIKSQDKYITLANKWVKKVDQKEEATQFKTKDEVKAEVERLKGFGYSEIKIV
jgi:SOS response regulatory protein OraA/RecX